MSAHARDTTDQETDMARQARSLDMLLAEVNKGAPRRSKLSDGGLGDPAHAARISDHNPNSAGVWRARDFTHDPKGGLDCNVLAAYLAARLGTHPALGSGAYVIWNRRIISTDRIDEGWRPYTGSNPHDKHCHLSVGTDASCYDNGTPFGWPSLRRLVVANGCKERGGDAAYLAYLKRLTGRGALIRQEVGRGLNSVRITPVRIKTKDLPLWVVGRIGAHRGVARSWMRINGDLVRVFNVHGLHNKTVGSRAHDRHLNRIARKTLALNGRDVRWVVAGDFNESVSKAAERMGGRPHGTGIVGFVVSPGLKVLAQGSDYHGKRQGWTDHPAYWIDLKKK